MAEKVKCLRFDRFAANCSFAKQQIIAIHINIGSVFKKSLFFAAWKAQASTHCPAVNVPIASSCEMIGKEHERGILRAGAIYIYLSLRQ